MILAFARRVVFAPGSNRMGAPAPPTWFYLLPSLEGWRIHAVGEVPERTRSGLLELNDPAGARTLVLVGAGADRDPAWGEWIRDDTVAFHAAPDQVEFLVRALAPQHEWWLSPGTESPDGPLPESSGRSVVHPPAPLGSETSAERWIGKAQRAVRRLAHRAGLRALDRTGSAQDPSGVPLGLHTTPRASSDGALFLPVGVNPQSVPDWIRRVAADADLDLSGSSWRMIPSRGYRSQKILFLSTGGAAGTGAAIKVTQDPRYNPRLENEGAALNTLSKLPGLAAHGFPRLRFAGHHRGLSVVGQEAVSGEPFRDRSTARADCPLAAAALRWLESLAVNSAQPASGTEVTNALQEVVDRFRTIYQVSPTVDEVLQRDLEVLREASVPSVFTHGDPGPWNLMVTPNDEVAFLDWENAEPRGLPLWDALYFLRTYGAFAAERSGVRWTPRVFGDQFLKETELSRMFEECVQRQQADLGLPRETLAPLLRTHLAALAAREAWSLNPKRLDRGTAVRLLELIAVEGPRSATWTRLGS